MPVIPQHDKQRLIQAFEEGRDFVELAIILSIKVKSARTIIRRYVERQNGNQVSSHGGARNVRVTNEIREFLNNCIDENCLVTLQELKEKIQMQFNIQLCLATIGKTLDGMLYTVKMVSDVPAQRNSADNKRIRMEYAQWYLQEGQNRTSVFIDETGFNVWTRRNYGRAIRGQRAFRTKAAQRGRNLTIIMAITSEGLVHFEFNVGGVTAERFQQFVDNLSALLIHQPCYFIMDNASCHNNCNPIDGNHLVKKLPPYSPFLNPIEESFSCLKSAVKRFLGNNQMQFDEANPNMNLQQNRMRLLQEGVRQSIPSITNENCAQWNAHMMGFLPRCMLQEDI